jgi:3-dehydroquinate synthase
MAKDKTIRLHRKRDPYPVLMGRGLLADSGRRLAELWGTRKRIAVVTQRRIDRLHGDQLRLSLEKAGLNATFISMREGEHHKNLDTVRNLYEKLSRHRFGREDGIVAFGGGVVGDTAGFVAATYQRGVELIQIPTTLVAQIDSALGAKVGVNLPSGKNLVGAFYRPAAVLIDPNILATLPTREFRSGLYELLKYGFIYSKEIFRKMESSPGTFRPLDLSLDRAIALSARVKLHVVRQDERESGLRRILNFGHTIGHGLETASGYRWLTHGQAVGWGMIAASRLAHRRGLIREHTRQRMEAAISGLGRLPKLGCLNRQKVIEAIRRDKKTGPQGLRFILPVGVGKVEVVEGLPSDEIAWVVKSLGVGRR